MPEPHIKFMALAISEAEEAAKNDEVPVGAAVVDQSETVLAVAGNQVITQSDPTAHAEIIALRKAASLTGNYRLLNTTLYVTVEPCPMCMGAAIHARVAKIVFGAFDPKWGAAGSVYDFTEDRRFNHQPIIISGVCENACRKLMQDFFRARRK
jgi:tRNA(adenine34) deaminase